MAGYYCNPMNFEYQYQFYPDNAANVPGQREDDPAAGRIAASREAADPSMIRFHDRYYIFPSMTHGFLWSDDMTDWHLQLSETLPAYDYAPDVRVVGEWLYFCASSHEQGEFYRTKDPFTDEYERIASAFPFWDPNQFYDDDGRLYLFWGSSVFEPLYGIELDPQTLQPIGEKVPLIQGDPAVKGFERRGENHVPERTPGEQAMLLQRLEEAGGMSAIPIGAEGEILQLPYIEGVWVNKFKYCDGRKSLYYLQYAQPGARFNVYNDAVYISESPLGPYRLAESNPFSYKPGGFFPGAGHGSTMEDRYGNLWHVSTMRIFINHRFERRIGIWKCGVDGDGELWCDQRFGDWPARVSQGKEVPWQDPEWMLLSYHKPVTATDCLEGHGPELTVDENVQTWWVSKGPANGRQRLVMDLEKDYDIRAVQINFADHHLIPPLSADMEFHPEYGQDRWIDTRHEPTRWILEASADGERYFVVEDKSETDTDLPHDLIVREDGFRARFLRLTVVSLPYGQAACVSGLRVFGLGDAPKPGTAGNITTQRSGELDLDVAWDGDGADGYVVCWGHRPDKLYHSMQTFEEQVRIGALVKGQEVYVRIDSWNESGITRGEVIKA